MKNYRNQNVKRLLLPSLVIFGASIVLFIILGILTVQNYSRERNILTRQLSQEGEFLIRILESGIKAGMMNDVWQPDQIRELFTETANDMHIDHIVLIDSNHIILKHNQPGYQGKKFTGLPLTQESEKIISEVKTGSWRKNTFHVIRKIPGISSFEQGKNYNNETWQRFIKRWNQNLAGKYIVVGLKMHEYNAAQTEDIRRAVIFGLILFLLGTSSIYFLFVIRKYSQINTSLRSLEAYTTNVVNSMPNGLISLDSSGKITKLNSNAAKMLDINPAEVIGKPLAGVMNECELDKTILSSSDIYEQQMDCKLNNGQIIPLSTTTSLLKNELGMIIGKVIILRDLQDIKTLERKIERSERLASLGRMAAGIAHEIRNPLSSIKGFAQYFKNKFKNVSEDAGYAQVMINEVDRLNRVIQNLLNFAKPQTPVFEPVDIRQIINHTLKLMESDLQEKRIYVDKQFDTELPEIEADSDMLTQVFLNIFINAVDAMDSEESILKIITSENAGGLSTTIADNGKGIQKSDLRKIFDPFFSLKAGGTGLGLAIVYRIIENHHGEIDVKSEPGKSTVFTIQLPFNQNKL